MSLAFTRGRCRYCGAAIGLFPAAVELGAIVVAMWAVAALPAEERWVGCLFGWTLLTLAWIDVRSMMLPDVLTVPLLAAGLIFATWRDPEAAAGHAIAAGAGYLGLRGVAFVYRRLRGRDGLGRGDAKLLAATGAWVGLDLLPWELLLAAILGLLAAGAGRLAGKAISGQTAIPFGPFLALSAWLMWLYGDIAMP